MRSRLLAARLPRYTVRQRRQVFARKCDCDQFGQWHISRDQSEPSTRSDGGQERATFAREIRVEILFQK